MSAAKNAVTAFEIKRALAEKHYKDFFITECKSGPTQIAAAGTLKILDGLAIKKSWTAPCFTGYEIKVSRSDFLRDAKFYTYEEICNCLYIVCPKGMIDRTELPESIGLMYYDPEKKTITTRKRAIYRKIEYTPELLLYIIFSRLDSDRIPFFSDRRAYFEAYAAGKTENRDLARAVNFYIRMMMGHGFRTTGEKVGWKNDVQGREAAYAAKCWAKTPEVIIQAAERLRGVQIENRPAVELIRRFNYQNVLIYADPPYMLGTRQNRKQYRHEMTDDDHMELLEAIKAHRGPAIISGYDSDLYNRELKGWYKDGRTSFTQTASKRREILWMNFEPAAQMDMFREE